MFWKNLYLSLCAKAIRYRIPLAVRQVYLSYDGFFNSLCPRCQTGLPWEYMAFCPQCGQRLSWILLDDAEELAAPLDTADLCSENTISFTIHVCRRHIKKSLFGVDDDTWRLVHGEERDIEEQYEDKADDDICV